MRGIALAAIGVFAAAAARAEEPWVWRATVTLDAAPADGRDRGAVFEAVDPDGRVVAGAGFLGAYNTYFRSDPATLQVFVKPVVDGPFEPAGPPMRPSDGTAHYLFDESGRTYAVDRSGGGVFEYLPGDATWRSVDRPAAPGMSIGGKRLIFDGNDVRYGGETIVQVDRSLGTAGLHYYAFGTLFFHLSFADSPENRTALYACPWSPGSEGPVDLEDAVALPLSVPREFPYSYGQHDGAVVVGTNNGGVHRFRNGRWQTLRAADPAVSFQLYTMLTYGERLLMGQYPTGELFEIVGDEVVRIEGWPPRPEGASPAAREAQTLTIYRGELFAGVWPWGEVWRLPEAAGPWQYMGRMFTHPAITPDTQAPYEPEMKALGEAVTNLWGQRVTGLTPTGADLIIATANKGGAVYEPRLTFLDDASWREYGAIHRFRLPGHLSVSLRPTDGPAALEFRIAADRMSVLQDGEELASAPLDPAAMDGFRIHRVNWGKGVFGAAAAEPRDYAVDAPETWKESTP